MSVAGTNPLVAVAHDDPAMCDALRFALPLEGVQVRVHESGAALLADEALPRCACVVLKYHLPGMDGLEVLHALRARALTMPVILLTNTATPALRARAKAAGVWMVLEKPILDRALIDAVAACLREIT